MRRRFITSDVFTDRAFGGNPLAVLPDATGLSTDQMQRLAREFNLSETAFVLPAESLGHDRKVRIFVPTKEIPFAGHPTIGTAMILAHLGAFDLAEERVSITFEMAAGLVPVTIHVNDGKPAAATLTAPRRPEIAEAPTVEQMAALLSLGKAQIMRTGAASAGNPFLMVQVEDRAALRQARVDMAVLDRIGEGLYAQEPFVFTDDAPRGADFRARMFAPLSGIPEDPATGSAVAAFGGWLGHHDALADGTIRKVVAQGLEMGRPSRLEVEVDKQGGAVIAVRVTGSAVLISEGKIEVPAPTA